MYGSFLVMYGSANRITIRQAGHPGKMFADLDSGDSGCNGPERAADFCRRFRLQVPGVELTWSAEKEQLNTRLITRCGGRAELLEPCQLGQAQPDGQAPRSQKVPPRHSGAQAHAPLVFKTQHGLVPPTLVQII